ncbi:MAG: methylated-DNA--[protein]-cysteine S-methyltransferase [Verrucomicrobiales bacterium]|jgi:AraC family transcriptional regulator of adaptative response/methylated-DNA-[protein]-cysteine methyltransferase|nr:methylated-DNA--[protein]-cysteine S-methyltransferase [Verrucomicrobiales bacterium]
MNDVNFKRVEKAIGYLVENFKRQPSLEEIAANSHVSPFHFQRIFSEWAGISPKKFLQFLTLEELKKTLMTSRDLIEAADMVGLSAQSRVYDLFVKIEAVTPDEYRRSGNDLLIEYGVHSTPFGDCFIAVTERGICSMSFVTVSVAELVDELNRKWVNAKIVRNQQKTLSLASAIFAGKSGQPLRLFLQGTKFQIKVWEALLKIPFGSLATYRTIAQAIGKPSASRAVGSAVGDNPVAYLIPCHRVIRGEINIGNYHWGSPRKAALIAWERAKNSN